MDWIQILAIVLTVFNVGALIVFTAKRDTTKALGHFIGILLILPIYGRIWGWW